MSLQSRCAIHKRRRRKNGKRCKCNRQQWRWRKNSALRSQLLRSQPQQKLHEKSASCLLNSPKWLIKMITLLQLKVFSSSKSDRIDLGRGWARVECSTLTGTIYRLLFHGNSLKIFHQIMDIIPRDFPSLLAASLSQLFPSCFFFLPNRIICHSASQRAIQNYSKHKLSRFVVED